MFTQTVYLFVTYSCNGCEILQFFISSCKMHAQFQGCWHKKGRTPIHGYNFYSNEKNLIYNFGNDLYFQNEEFSL